MPFTPGLSWKVTWGLLGLLVGFIILGKYLLSRPPKVRALDSSGRVTGIVGRLGSGKSYLAVKLAYRNLLAGAHCCTNFSMHLAHTEACPVDCERGTVSSPGRWLVFTGFEQFQTLHGEFRCPVDGTETAESVACPKCRRATKLVRRMVVIVDEAHVPAPATGWVMPPDMLEKLTNMRKHGLDFIWLTQHESRVSKKIRDITNEMYVCKRPAKESFTATCYQPEDIRKEGKAVYTMKYKLEMDIATLYDTMETVKHGTDASRGWGGGASEASPPTVTVRVRKRNVA